MLPELSTNAMPDGRINWPLPEPKVPNVNRKAACASLIPVKARDKIRIIGIMYTRLDFFKPHSLGS